MDTPTLIVTDLPELSDESAGQLYDFLNAFVTAYEERYNTQLRRYYELQAIPEPQEPPDDVWFEGFDEIPF